MPIETDEEIRKEIKEIKKIVNGIKNTMFGANGTGGVVGLSNWLKGGFAIVVVLLGFTSINTFTSSKLAASLAVELKSIGTQQDTILDSLNTHTKSPIHNMSTPSDRQEVIKVHENLHKYSDAYPVDDGK